MILAILRCQLILKKYFEFFKDYTSNKKIQSYKKGSERNGFRKLCRKDQSS